VSSIFPKLTYLFVSCTELTAISDGRNWKRRLQRVNGSTSNESKTMEIRVVLYIGCLNSRPDRMI
jgi:hypothetical protein